MLEILEVMHLTINPNSLKYQGATSPNPVYNTNGQAIHIVYSGATKRLDSNK